MPILIDQTKCAKDGLCAKECPMGLITMNDHMPTIAEYAEQRCIACGHCVAVCPHDALSLRNTPLEACPPLKEGWQLTPEQVEQLLKGRRSIRVYKQQDVAREVLLNALDMARYAPTGHNSQSVQWRVIHNGQRVQELVDVVIDWMRKMIEDKSPLANAFGMGGLVRMRELGADPICRNAPHLIIAHAPKDDRIAGSSATIGLSYLELAALPLGLGTCWAGFFQIATSMSPEVAQALGLPEGHQSFGAMMIGYPQWGHHRIPPRKPLQMSWDAGAN